MGGVDIFQWTKTMFCLQKDISNISQLEESEIMEKDLTMKY